MRSLSYKVYYTRATFAWERTGWSYLRRPRPVQANVGVTSVLKIFNKVRILSFAEGLAGNSLFAILSHFPPVRCRRRIGRVYVSSKRIGNQHERQR
jgi:hypothetical protein